MRFVEWNFLTVKSFSRGWRLYINVLSCFHPLSSFVLLLDRLFKEILN